MVSLFSDLSATAVGALFSAIWQGTLLAVCVALCLRLIPGLGAAARSVIWMNVFALLLLLHVLPAFSGYSQGTNPVQAPLFHLDPRWSIALAGAWALLSLWRAAQLLLSAIRLRGLASQASPLRPDPALQALLETQAGGQLWSRSAELCTSTDVQRPSMLGFFRPRILLPPDLLQKLSPVEMQQVVLHEMEHLRRADNWTNLLQKLGLVLFPLNPVLLWVERRLCAERELACDDRVLRLSPGRKAYALCLTRLAEHSMLRRSLSLALGAWERQSELVRRVHRILVRPVAPMRGKPAMLASAGLILGALACAVTLARSPQIVGFAPRAQSTPLAYAVDQPMQPAGLRAPQTTPHLVKTIVPVHPRPRRVSQAASTGIVARNESPAPAPSTPDAPQQWVVLTEWQSTAAPPQLVITVYQNTQRTYAAVSLANGWLIVQI
jgi:beta-lactamase regulating signal transducer with metallopeptidase domain